MQIYDVIIIGSGPSGIMCSVQIKNKKVLLLEANTTLGGKIKVSGGGRCNVTNNKEIEPFLKNVVKNNKFLYSTFQNMPPQDLINFFEKNNVKLKEEDNNRIFPEENTSQAIINYFIGEIHKSNNINFKTDYLVESIIHENNQFIINDQYKATEVVFATGGITYPHLSQKDIGHRLLGDLGHKTTDLVPAESPLISNDSIITDRTFQGITLIDSQIEVFINQKKKYKFDGNNVLFTHFGITGPLALKSSHHIKEALNNQKKVKVRVIPGEHIPKKMQDIFNETGYIDINIVDIKGFNTAFLTNGGIKVKEVENKTFKSKIQDNLYIIGEVLDINAYTGGFNIALCLSEGYTCGQYINTSIPTE